MKNFLVKWTNVFLSISLFSFFTLSSIDSVIAAPTNPCISGFTLVENDCERTYQFSGGAQNFRVPDKLGAITIELVGGAGGAGGLDCGTGCVPAQSGPVGRLVLNFEDLGGKDLRIYPGDSGKAGASGVSASGGGAAGISSFNQTFNGGRGGDTGPDGTSGAGGGGGAATLLTIGNKRFIAAGGGGGGGSANSYNGSTSGNTASKFVSQGSRGGEGVSSTPNFFADGGGGGGGGAGIIGGAGGDLYRAPDGGREAAGNGGAAGTNTPAGAEVKSSGYVEPRGSGSVLIRYVARFAASGVNLLSLQKTNSKSHSYQLLLDRDQNFTADDVELSGSATSQSMFKVTVNSKKATNSGYSYKFTVSQVDDVEVLGDLDVTVFDVSASTVQIDQRALEATITIQPDSLTKADHVYDVKLNKAVLGISAASFAPVTGTAVGCSIGDVIGSDDNYQVWLTGCSDGTFGIRLLAGSVKDLFGNSNPADIISSLLDKQSPVTESQLIPGTIAKEFVKQNITTVFGSLSAETEDALAALGIYAPMPGAPTVSLNTDLTTVAAGEQLTVESSQNLDAGSTLKLSLTVNQDLAQSSDVVAFLKTGDTWQYLGRSTFTNLQASSEGLGISSVGNFRLRLVVIPKAIDTTRMSLTSGFGKSLTPKQSVTEQQTAIGDQIVNININSQAGQDGVPATIEPTTQTPEPFNPLSLEINLPKLAVGVPVANPAIGATGDDNAPSIPFDPLGTPEAVKQVTKTTVTAVALVSSIAAAAGAAVSAAAGAASAAGVASAGSSSSTQTSSTTSQSSNQDTDQADGSITTIDAAAESFTSKHLGLGDRNPIFRLGIFTFLDSFTHNLTLKTSRLSPVLAKIINDGAYLRAIFGSLWLAFPALGVWLASQALLLPSSELAPPVWTLFIAIGVLGIFDAFSGMLATFVYVVGAISIHGIGSVSDIRMMLGVMVLGFGPALVAISFRAIRKHFETSFSYLWERLVDVAVLTFFTGWTVSSMVSTLPALAGKTLQAANHVHDFGFYLSIAIVVRVIFEEIAARVYPNRLDVINPTELPDPRFVQKVLSTALRLGLFVFVTAAFMGNTWQVWVGSLIFILPNILSWIEEKLPNSPFIWQLIPVGIPGLALSLLVAGYTSLGLTAWLGDNPEYSQYAFMLLPVPMFVLGVIGLFGRSGKSDDDERLIKRRSLRWVYRLGGIVMLLLTIRLAGVI